MDAGVLYDSDTYADDLPYWSPHFKRTNGEREGESPLLLIPYTLSNNDMKFVTVNVRDSNDSSFISSTRLCHLETITL